MKMVVALPPLVVLLLLHYINQHEVQSIAIESHQGSATKEPLSKESTPDGSSLEGAQLLLERGNIVINNKTLFTKEQHTSADEVQPNPHRSQQCSDKYTLSDTYRGNDFWEPAKFFFFEWGDPTGGAVKYVGKGDAQRYSLIKTTSDGRAQIFSDTTEIVPRGEGRKSIRITSQRAWSDAMWILDLNHMPTGCGTWPAFWTVGWDPWPDTGEIDIIEGANVQEHAHSALHTKKGCTMPSSTDKFNGYWSNTSYGKATDCWNLATPDNTGCSIESYEDAYGAPLNRKGGGFYVMQLHHDKYIRIWFFTRQEAPSDIISGIPTPDFWTKKPLAYFDLGSKCPGRTYFQEQRVVINTTFCGGYSGYNFTYAQGCPGNGLTDCENYVRNNPSAFRDAYWDINSLKIYRRNGQKCQQVTTTTTTTTRRTTTTAWPTWTSQTTQSTRSNTRSTSNNSGSGSNGGSGSTGGSTGGNGGTEKVTSTTTVTTSRKKPGGWWPWPTSGAFLHCNSLVVILGLTIFSLV